MRQERVTSCIPLPNNFHAQLQLCNLRVRGTNVVAVPSSSLKAVTAAKVTWPRIAKKRNPNRSVSLSACFKEDYHGLSIFFSRARNGQDFNVCDDVSCVLLRTCQCNSNIYIRPFLSLVSRLWCHEVDGPRDRLGNRQSHAEDCDAVRSHHLLMRKFDIKRCTQQTSPTSSNQSSSAKQKTE